VWASDRAGHWNPSLCLHLPGQQGSARWQAWHSKTFLWAKPCHKSNLLLGPHSSSHHPSTCSPTHPPIHPPDHPSIHPSIHLERGPSSPASISPPMSGVCVWERNGGKLGSGIPQGKAAQSLPRAAGDPGPKQETARLRPGSGPSPDFPPGWGSNDSPLLPPSLVSLFAFLLPATWRPLEPLTGPTTTPQLLRPLYTPRGSSYPLRFLGALACAH
jgi:hypothetical protein